MAEISEKFEPETMRRSKPGLKRVYVTVSVLVSFVLGFPLLYKSVEIYRAPLPFHDVDSLSNDVAPPAPYHFHALFLNSHLHTQQLRASLLSQITKLTSPNPNPNPNFTLSVSTSPEGCTQPSGCGSICAVDLEGGDDDDVVDEKLEGVLGGEGCGGFGGKAYSVVVAVDGGGGRGVRAVVGKYRHGWVVVGSEVGAGEMVEVAAEMFVKVFANGGREEEGGIKGEFMPVGSDGRIVLSFSLLNAEPRDWVFDWDFQMIDEMLLAPVIEALAPIANISVESQVLYHTPKSSFSPWDKNLGSYIFSTKDLPFFVNSNEWHLDTSIAAGGRSKILQFVVYIPSAKECPLLLQLPNKEISSTNGFISPMWGGVVVWNPQGCLKVSENKLPDMHMISSQDLQKVFEVFMGQFRQLFGLKSERIYVGSSGTYNLLPSERGFTEWELDFLSREHTYFNLHSSATTLGSLSRLVQSLPRMIIMDEIGKQVKYSVEAAKLAQSNASLGVYNASAVLSRQARSLAEDAFFHPSIMSVSYYSFEHCFAVYSPFFLPVSMHVLLAALREWKRYKQEKAKYLLWKATVKVTS